MAAQEAQVDVVKALIEAQAQINIQTEVTAICNDTMLPTSDKKRHGVF